MIYLKEQTRFEKKYKYVFISFFIEWTINARLFFYKIIYKYTEIYKLMLARCGYYLPHKKKLSTAKNHQLISFWQIQVIWFGGFLTVWILDHYSGEGVYNHIRHLFPRQTDKTQPQSILAYHKWPSSSRILFSNAVKILRQSKKCAITDKCFLMSKKKTIVNVPFIIPLLTKKGENSKE